MSLNQSPSLICIGGTEEITEFTIDYLQKVFCPHRKNTPAGLCRCKVCVNIAEHQSSHVTWVEPKNDYVLEDIEPIFTTIRYTLEQDTHHAFIINQAESLSIACANRLLKVVEEPPAGYFFMFLTSDYAALLPTIQSRSTIVYTAPHHTPPQTGALSYFLDAEKQNDPVGLDGLLKNQPLSVAQTKLLVHQLALSINYEHYPDPAAAAAIIEKAQRNFPQPGGTSHYIRWLFMALHLAQQKL